MPVTTGNAIQQSELDALATLANTKLSPGVAYSFAAGATNFLTELQRIRTDLLAAINGAPLAAEFRVSELQAVGINPCFSPGENGRLYLGSSTDPVPATYLPKFRAVEFWYALIDGWTWDDAEIELDDPDAMLDAEPPVIQHRLKFNLTSEPALTDDHELNWSHDFFAPASCQAAIVIEIPLVWDDVGSPVAPDLEDFSLASDFAVSDWDIVADGSGWKIVLLADAIIAGSTTFDSQFTSSGPWAFGAATATVNATVILTIAEGTGRAAVTVIHPGSTGRKVSIADVTNAASYTVDGARGIDYLELTNNRNCRGVWFARTLPTPALNLFIDQDIPPYVQRIVNGAMPLYLTEDLSTWALGVRTASALKSRLVPDDQSPPAYYRTASGMKQGAPYYAHEDEVISTSSDNYATFAAGATLELQMIFPYWLHSPWTDDPVDFDVFGQDFLTAITNAPAPALTIYVSNTPDINPADPGTYDFSVNDVGSGSTLAQVTLDQIVTHLGSLTRTVYFLIRNTSGSSVFLNVGQVLFESERTIREVTPGMEGQPARWPVMRDTDDYPWFEQMDPFRAKWIAGSGEQTVGVDGTYTFEEEISASLAARIHVGQRNWQLTASAPVPIFVKLGGPSPNPANPATYDFYTLGGVLRKNDVDLNYPAGTTGTLYCTAWNNQGAPLQLTITGRGEYEGQKFQRRPVFYPTNAVSDDPAHLLAGVCESYSYNLVGGYGGAANTKLVPRRGYVVHSLRVRRLPKAINPDVDYPIYLPPTAPADLTPLAVKIGQWRGLKHTEYETIDKGVFEELTEVTIPDGQLEARVDVFWPVLHGALLVYQATTAVQVEALASWQPLFHGIQYAAAPVQAATGITPVLPPDALCFDETGRFDNAFWDDHPVQFPIAAVVYNDLMAALDLL